MNLRFLSILAIIASAINLPLQASWERLNGVQLLPSQSNDADSFLAQYRDEKLVIRIYYVDAPETNLSFHDRVRQQAKHHGRSVNEVLEIGRYGTRVVAEALSNPFSIITRRENALGRSSIPRIYAFVITSDGYDLGQVLLSEGLARAYGVVSAPPGRAENEIIEEYHHLENFARQKGYGIYSPSPLQSIRRPDIPGGGAVSAGLAAEISPDTQPRINLNAATKKELQLLPGIGDVLSSRIIDARPLRGMSDLHRIRGMRKDTLSRIKPLIEF